MPEIKLESILDWITENVYDASHIGALTGNPNWVVSSRPLLKELARLSSLNDSQMGKLFDEARLRVHGPNVKG